MRALVSRLAGKLKTHFLVTDIVTVAIVFFASSKILMRLDTVGVIWEEVSLRSFFGTIASLAGGLVGFTVTGVTIVSALSGEKRLRLLREDRPTKAIFAAFFSATRWLAGLALVSLAGMILRLPHHYYAVLAHVVFFMVFVCVARFTRLVWILHSLGGLIPEAKERPRPPTIHDAPIGIEEGKRLVKDE